MASGIRFLLSAVGALGFRGSCRWYHDWMVGRVNVVKAMNAVVSCPSVFRSRTAFQSVALSSFSCLIPRRCMMPAMPPIPRIDAIT